MGTSKGIIRLLVADDDPVTSKVLEAMLRDMGHWVDVCHDGEKALELAVLNPYSLVILDFDMPSKSGAEVVRNLRCVGNGVPAVIVSAHPLEEIRPKVADLEIARIIAKPANRVELEQAIRQLTGPIRA